MKLVKVGIVEDDAIIGMSIVADLQSLGYLTTNVAGNFEAAEEMIASEQPDILLIDIMLGTGRDGVELAVRVKEQYRIPVIFVTANCDAATVTRAKKASPAAYLVKPFDKDDLYTSIEVALNNYGVDHTLQVESDRPEDKQPKEVHYRINNALFAKQGALLHKIAYDDILFMRSENVYLYLHTVDRTVAIRTSLTAYLDYLGSDMFFRVHRSYAVNLHKIDAIQADAILLQGHSIPMSKVYRTELINSLRTS